MTIMMLSRDFATDGLVSCVLMFSNTLVEKGHRVIVCCEDGENRKKLSPEVCWEKVNLYTKEPTEILQNIQRLTRIIKREHVDCIHCHWRMNAVYAQILKIITGVDFVWTNHSVPIPYDFLHRITTFYGKKAIAISQESSQFLRQNLRIPERKIAAINNGIDLRNYHRLTEDNCVQLKQRWGISYDAKIITLFGRLSEEKGHFFLLDAVKDLDEDFQLIFTGEGPEEYKNRLRARIDDFGLSQRVVFTGNVSVNDVLSITDLAVLPSRSEGFPLVTLEEMAFSIPIIRTKAGGYQDMADCVDGVDYGDVAALSASIRKNLQNGADVQARVKYAYKQLTDRWTIDKVMDHYLDVYRS